MKFSEAVIEGLKEVKPSNVYYLIEEQDGGCAACAIGAALHYTLGVRNLSTDVEDKLIQAFPWTGKPGRDTTIAHEMMQEISGLFEGVVNGQKDFQVVIDYADRMEAKYGEPARVELSLQENEFATI